MKKNVLIIDDSEVTREALWRALHSSFPVVLASCAREGLKKLSSDTGLVFLDIVLPDLNGLDVLKRIKHDYPSVPVVMITGHGNEEACINAFRRGARDYVKKPFTPEDILQKAEMLLYINSVATQGRQPIPLSGELYSPTCGGDARHIPSNILKGILLVKEFIDQNPTTSLDLSYAAKMAAMNRTYFCKYFKEVIGYTFKDYLVCVRFKIAREVLNESNANINEVAEKAGYKPKYFSEAFKKACGAPPTKAKK